MGQFFILISCDIYFSIFPTIYAQKQTNNPIHGDVNAVDKAFAQKKALDVMISRLKKALDELGLAIKWFLSWFKAWQWESKNYQKPVDNALEPTWSKILNVA